VVAGPCMSQHILGQVSGGSCSDCHVSLVTSQLLVKHDSICSIQ
jgi:hypothetical protein